MRRSRDAPHLGGLWFEEGLLEQFQLSIGFELCRAWTPKYICKGSLGSMLVRVETLGDTPDHCLLECVAASVGWPFLLLSPVGRRVTPEMC